MGWGNTQRAWRICEQDLRSSVAAPPIPPVSRRCASSVTTSTIVGKLDEAEPLLTKAAAESTATWGPAHPTSLLSAEYLAELQSARGLFAEAEGTYRRYLEEARRAPKPDQESHLDRRQQSRDWYFYVSGKTDEAEGLYRRLVEDSRRIRGVKHPGTLSVLNNLAILLEKQQKFAEAEQLFRECLELNSMFSVPSIPAPWRPDITWLMSSKTRVASTRQRSSSASTSRSSANCRAPTIRRRSMAISGLGSLLRVRGKLDEAEALLIDSLDVQERTLGADNPDTVRTTKRLASIRADRARQSTTKASNVAGLHNR